MQPSMRPRAFTQTEMIKGGIFPCCMHDAVFLAYISETLYHALLN